MTLKKKLTEVGTVDPTLADHVVTNQAHAVKQSSLSKVYDLFKLGYDAVYAKITDLANYVTNSSLAITLSSYATTSAVGSALSGYTTTPDLTILLAGKQNTYVNNVATGVSSVVINGKSGTATFTAFIGVNATNMFSVTNSQVNANSKIIWSLMYQALGGNGQPQVVNHDIVGTTINFNVKNIGLANTNNGIVITFMIVN